MKKPLFEKPRKGKKRKIRDIDSDEEEEKMTGKEVRIINGNINLFYHLRNLQNNDQRNNKQF